MQLPKLSSSIIIHALGFTLVILFSLSLVFYNLFHNVDNQRLSLRKLLSPQTWYQILTYRYQSGVTCQKPVLPALPSWLEPGQYQTLAAIANTNDLIVAKSQSEFWTIYRTNSLNQELLPLAENIYFPSPSLSLSYAPVSTVFAYPDCTNDRCFIYLQDLYTGVKSQFPAFNGPSKLPATHIRDVFFDETRKLMSYGASESPDSPRVVINTNQELVQVVNEIPAKNRHLEFKWYLPNPGLMVYFDPVNHQTYFYQIDKIGLFTHFCPGI